VGIRTRVVLLTLAVIAVVDILVGTYLERELRGSLESGMWSELYRHAQSARVLLESYETEVGPKEADSVADRSGAATSARITIVREDGTVVGDSEFEVDALPYLGSHANRPEIRDAFALHRGDSTRFSATMGEQMLYVAVPVYGPKAPALAVRAALPINRMQVVIDRMRRAVALAGLFSLVIATLLMVLASKLVAKTLRSVVSTAQAVAGPMSSVGDEGSRSFSQMAMDLERALAMLAAERNRFEAVLQTMDQAVLALDAKQRITTVNRAGRALLGLRQDPEGLTLLEAIRVPALNELVEQVTRGESALRRAEAQLEPRRSGAEGASRPTDVDSRSVEFDIGGRRVEARATAQSDGGTVLVILDVTEIRRLERVRRDFVANVSHELRTPISVIRANTETLLEGGLEDTVRARQFVEAVLRHAERLGRLVSDLLDISRIEAGRYRLEPACLNLADAVDHVLDSVEVEARAKGIDLAVDIDPDLEICTDRKALEQVLINLVGNAVKYTPAGGHVDVTARLQTGGDIDMIRLEVQDDGPGIDPTHRQRIFERFYRVDPGRSRDMGGTGLGLSIVKHLVEVMEGAVGIESRSPQGSVFWVTLPANADGLDLGSSADETSVFDDGESGVALRLANH